MTIKVDLLTGSCPGSGKEIGVEHVGEQVPCQRCGRSVEVTKDGVVWRHQIGFHYLDTKGCRGLLEVLGRDTRSSVYFNFAVGGEWGRAVAHMAFSLDQLKLLQEFLSGFIDNIEQECARSPGFHARVNSAEDYIQNPPKPSHWRTPWCG